MPTTGSQPTPPIIFWPPPPPGVAGLIHFSGSQLGRIQEPFLGMPARSGSTVDSVRLPLTDLATLEVQLREARPRRLGFSLSPMILDLEVRADPTRGAIDLERLREIAEDPALGLHGIRLSLMAGDEPS